MDYKICSKCNHEKKVTDFHKSPRGKFGRHSICKKCKAEYMSNRWHHDDDYKKRKKEYFQSRERRDYYKNYMRKKRLDPKYKEKAKEYMKEYWQKNNAYEYHKKLIGLNPDYKKRVTLKANKFQKNKRETDMPYRISVSLRNRISKLIKHNKKGKTLELLGCTKEFFVKYIESMFDEKMSWHNYGKYWHIDHIVPCDFFDFSEMENQFICFNYRNMQPLEKIKNIRKSNKLPSDYQNIINKIKDALKSAS